MNTERALQIACLGFPCTLCCVIPYFMDENRKQARR